MNVIVIPIYKPIPDKYEENSFNQCLKILFRHTVCLITFENLDISYYTQLLDTSDIKYRIEYFDKIYFESLASYNRLMMLKDFYLRFKNYGYMLIYQLDAYFFRDELDYWCEQGYDYIGAPLFGDEYLGMLNDENPDSIGIGNGGFSLRKIKSQLKVLNTFSYLIPAKTLFKSYMGKCLKQPVLQIIPNTFDLLKNLTIENNTHHFFNSFSENEDGFWGELCKSKFKWYSLPSFESAYRFSFEILPEYLYELNDEQLPFGCHKWCTEPNLSFWKEHSINHL